VSADIGRVGVVVQVETIGDAALYCGDCLEILPALGKVDAVIADPPYGMKWNTNSSRYSGGENEGTRGRGIEWAPVHGDAEPFDPAPWLEFQRVVLFGSNHYAQRLPVGTTLVWVKRLRFGTFLSDAEVGWMKGGHGVYCHHDVSMNGAGANFEKLHPTQKPVGLMEWCIELAKVPADGVVLDPYMGSGTTGAACTNMDRKFIGIEIEPKYFEIACERIENAQRQARLFA